LRFPMMTSRIAWAPEDGSAGGGNSGGTDGGGNSGAGDFLAQIPEAIRGEVAFKDIKDVGTLATSYLNAHKMIGVPPDQVLKLAGPDDAEGWNAIWSKLGRPDAPDKYQLADPEKLPDGLSIDAERKTAFAKTAHELGLTQKQAAALYGTLNSERIAGFEKITGDLKAGIAAVDTALKAKWGDGYGQKSGALNLAIDHLSRQFELGDDLRQAVDNTPGKSGIAVRAALAEVGALMQEHGLIGKGGAAEGALTPAEATQQINGLLGDPVFSKVLNDKAAPGHADAVAKITRLYQFQTPQRQAA
jgi:hypothetical protein